MAGGMSRRGSWGSMAERVAASNPTEPAPLPEPPALRHCWVVDSHGRLPGLLLGWQRREGAWSGHVARAVLQDGEWILVEEWLPAGLLEPADDGRHAR